LINNERLPDLGFLHDTRKYLKKLVIAIDGPAASGKSTTAKLVAKRLGYMYIDTGAMYRAMTLKVLENNIPIVDEHAISKLAENTRIEMAENDDHLKVFLDKRDVSKEIRSQDVTNAASAVSSYGKVRELMVREQQRIGRRGGVVVEGRDIGTVVFPDAELKIFMVASPEIRAERRRKELEASGVKVPVKQLVKEIIERDRKDSERSLSPLKRADGAIMLDTSHMTIDGQVDFILDKVKKLTNRTDESTH
jgi:cytidylate kinase